MAMMSPEPRSIFQVGPRPAAPGSQRRAFTPVQDNRFCDPRLVAPFRLPWRMNNATVIQPRYTALIRFLPVVDDRDRNRVLPMRHDAHQLNPVFISLFVGKFGTKENRISVVLGEESTYVRGQCPYGAVHRLLAGSDREDPFGTRHLTRGGNDSPVMDSPTCRTFARCLIYEIAGTWPLQPYGLDGGPLPMVELSKRDFEGTQLLYDQRLPGSDDLVDQTQIPQIYRYPDLVDFRNPGGFFFYCKVQDVPPEIRQELQSRGVPDLAHENLSRRQADGEQYLGDISQRRAAYLFEQPAYPGNMGGNFRPPNLEAMAPQIIPRLHPWPEVFATLDPPGEPPYRLVEEITQRVFDPQRMQNDPRSAIPMAVFDQAWTSRHDWNEAWRATTIFRTYNNQGFSGYAAPVPASGHAASAPPPWPAPPALGPPAAPAMPDHGGYGGSPQIAQHPQSLPYPGALPASGPTEPWQQSRPTYGQPEPGYNPQAAYSQPAYAPQGYPVLQQPAQSYEQPQPPVQQPYGQPQPYQQPQGGLVPAAAPPGHSLPPMTSGGQPVPMAPQGRPSWEVQEPAPALSSQPQPPHAPQGYDSPHPGAIPQQPAQPANPQPAPAPPQGAAPPAYGTAPEGEGRPQTPEQFQQVFNNWNPGLGGQPPQEGGN